MKPVALLVEHNAWLGRLLRAMLERAGCQVLAATDLREARQHLEAHLPNLVLVDHGLDDGDGLDLMQMLWRIHENGKPVRPPVVVMTTPNGHDPDPQRLHAIGARGSEVHHVLKPLNVSAMESLVRDCLAARPEGSADEWRWRTARADAQNPATARFMNASVRAASDIDPRAATPHPLVMDPLEDALPMRRSGTHADGDLWIDGDWGVQR